MRLSFKKSILLFTTVALGSMLGTSAQDPQTTNDSVLVEGYTFKQDWKSEEVPKSTNPPVYQDCRQGFGQNNQFIIQNMNSTVQKVQIYDKNGYVGDFAASGTGGNITKDEAGNVIVRTGTFNLPYFMSNQLMFIKADGSQSVSVTLPTDYAPRTPGYFWGSAEGDIFSAEGGKLSFTGASLEYFITIEIKNGAITGGYQVDLPYLFGSTNMRCSVDDVVNAWKDANGKRHYMVVHRSENPIDITLDENNDPTATTINTHSYNNYGTSNGTNTFAFNGKNYIMFSTSPNWNDGFVIAELGTDADGKLDGTVNVVAQHVNDYTDPMGANVGSTCNWLNWEPRNANSIYIYQYFPGYYMARYIFGIETDETTLDDIVNDGTPDETYTVADDILGVYIAEKEPTRVYAKDYGKHRHPSTIEAPQVDFVMGLTDDDENHTNLQQDKWDQSNWVILDFETAAEAQKFAGKIGETNQGQIACKVIKGGTLTGKLTNKLNPTMTVTSYVEPTETIDYLQNSYIPCNFMTPNVQSNIFWHGETHDYFFIEPKAQEYVKVWWALYEEDNHFTIKTDSDFKGSFNVDWSLYPGEPGEWEQDFIPNNAYNFHAIVRYVASTKDDAHEGNYIVYPLEGGADVFTAIENVSARGEVASVTYVNMLGMESSTPFKGINIVVTRYTSGEALVKKELH